MYQLIKISAASSPCTHRNGKEKIMPNTNHTEPTVFTLDCLFYVSKCRSSIYLLLVRIVVLKRRYLVNFF